MTRRFVAVPWLLVGLSVSMAAAQSQPSTPPAPQGAASGAVVAPVAEPADPVRALVGRLDLEQYKATIKGLTQFGDRRQGTDRNRAAVDWIEAQLKSYGCANAERITYDYQPPQRGAGSGASATGRGAAGAGGDTPSAATQGRGGRGGNPPKGNRAATGVNNDPMKQPDVKVRELDLPPSVPGARQEVYCTKTGTTHPEEMYIIGGHMDGIGYAEAANDNGSGTAIVMELARIFSAPNVQTDRSIRFVLWNNEETGLNGARAYVEQRRELQGKENPPGSGKYPEPKWLGMIQHDMMLFDHGMPRADGTLNPEQRAEADVNVEFAGTAKMASEAQALAWLLRAANDRYATDYPVAVGNRMSNTDSAAFQDFTAAVSLREAERLSQVGSGWDPHWHQPTDLFANFTDRDFRLGLNAAQTTLAAVAQLAGATIK
ncbi:MAG: M20/M25/M40 family metallo-hydrolase [Acidobacteriota bacterium]